MWCVLFGSGVVRRVSDPPLARNRSALFWPSSMLLARSSASAGKLSGQRPANRGKFNFTRMDG